MSTAEDDVETVDDTTTSSTASTDDSGTDSPGKAVRSSTKSKKSKDDKDDTPLRTKIVRGLIVALVVLVIGSIVALLWTYLLPRWWAQQIGKMTGGTFIGGALWGGLMGFALTLVPLLLIGLGLFRRWRFAVVRVVLLVLAVMVALPNLVTLSVSIAPGRANDVARTTLDVTAPFFRGGTAVGAIVAAVVVLGVWIGGVMHWRRKHQLDKLEDRLEEATGKTKR